MSTWTERARKALFLQKGQFGTDKTDENTFSRRVAVSSVPAKAISQKNDRVLSVLTVASSVVAKKLDVVPNTIAESQSELIDIGTVRPAGLSPVLLAASMALDAAIAARDLSMRKTIN